MARFLTLRQKVCVGFYCTCVLTVVVMLMWYCLFCVESELHRIHRKTRLRSVYLPMTVHLPSNIIYNKGEIQFVRREEDRNLYRNTLEDNVLKLPWVQELHQMLLNANSTRSPQVNIVVTDRNGIEMLLNWLVAALVRLKEPLHNVIVLGLDAEVCEVLHPHNVSCIHSDPGTFIRQNTGFLHFSRAFLAPQTRLLAARLINYWGYSFASYDTDALILKNPQSLYDSHREVNLIAGAAGHWPEWAIRKWGFSVCLGAVMIRSGPTTGGLW